jgi:hypothetical protein
LALVALVVRQAEDKAAQTETTLFFQPQHLLVVATELVFYRLVETLVALAVRVEEPQKTEVELAVLEILHQHHHPKEVVAAQQHPEAQKAVLVVVAHPLWEQVELALAQRSLVVLVVRVLRHL